MDQSNTNNVSTETPKIDLVQYTTSDSFDVKFDILKHAALKYPNYFSRSEAFKNIPISINERTQQRLLEGLSNSGYLHKNATACYAEYKINPRAFMPFFSLLQQIKKRVLSIK